MSNNTYKDSETQLNQNATFYSKMINLEDNSSVSVQISTSNGSSFTGTSTVQVSNNYTKGWVDLTDTTVSISVASNIQIYDITETSAAYVRIKITITAGSADFDFAWMIK
jgi:hypothetical protein